MPNWFADTPLFVSQLRTGHEFAEVVAQRLRGRGIAVRVTPMEIRSDIEDRHRFADEHDLTVGRHRKLWIDVKSRNLRFTGVADYPYPTALVDTLSGWRAKTRKPAAVVIVSQVTGAMVVVPRSTEPSWTVHQRSDRLRGIEDSFLEVARELLRPFEDLAEWIQRVDSSDGS
jgi:hypothetical protein